jgi:hypothetical protein
MGIELERIEIGHAEESDTFQTVIAILIAIVSLAGAVAAWQSTLVEDDDADRAGLQASLNAETTHLLNNAGLYKHYRAYTTYTLNNELEQQIESDLDYTPLADQPYLERQQAQSVSLAGTGQLFFPTRYLNRDGSYNTQRELGENWAQAEQRLELDPQPHFDEADAERRKGIITISIITILTFSLLFYTLAEGMYPARHRLRLSTAILGTFFLTIGIIAAIAVQVFL